MKNFFESLYYMTIGRVLREIRYRKKMKELSKRDPFIY